MRKKILRLWIFKVVAIFFLVIHAVAAKRTKNFRLMPKRVPATHPYDSVIRSSDIVRSETSTAPVRGLMARAPLRVAAGRWTPEVRAALDRFLAERGEGAPGYNPARPPVAVLPWSDAMVVGDPAELVFLCLTTKADFRFNDRWWEIIPVAYGRRPARVAYEHFIQLSSSVWQAQPEYHNYRKAILASYIELCRGVGRRECRQYLMRLWAGWNEKEAVDYSRQAIEEEKTRPAALELVRAEEGDAAPLRVRRGLRHIAEMRDLAIKLRAAGVDVWVVDDLPQPVLTAAAADYGIDPSRVVGVRATVVGAFLTASVRKPVPTRGGKTEIVQSALGRSADLVIGRDAADIDLLAYGNGLRVALSGDPEFEALARRKGWLIQPSMDLSTPVIP